MPSLRQKVCLRHDPCTSVNDPFASLESDHPHFEVRDVHRTGRGLFVLQSFRKDKFLLNYRNYRGQMKTQAECSDNIYSIETGPPELLVLDATDSHCLARLINDVDPFHSQNYRPVKIYNRVWFLDHCNFCYKCHR